MKITKIEIQKKNKKRYNLYIDDAFNMGIHEDVIVNLGLHVKQVLSESDYNDIVLKEVEAKAKQEALKYISYRLRSEFEVKEKLEALDYSEPIIHKIIAFLWEHGLLNDVYFTKAFIHDKINIAKHSLRRIKYDLKAKGIHEAMFNEIYLNDFDLQEDYYNNLVKSIGKKHKSMLKKDKYNDYEIKQKVLQYFGQKGFEYSLLKDAYSEMIENDSNHD